MRNLPAGMFSALLTFHFGVAMAAATAAKAATAGEKPAIESAVVLPADFPAGFEVYSTVVEVDKKLVTLRHGNALALQAARAGAPLPDGSMIVVVEHALMQDAKDQALAGSVQSYAVMAAQTGWGSTVPAPLRNGNWGYALFNAKGQRSASFNQQPCLACHLPLAQSSYVFTLDLLRQQAQRGKPGAGP